MRDVNRREEECLRSRRDAINTSTDDVVGVEHREPHAPTCYCRRDRVRGRVGGCQLARHDVEREMGNKKRARPARYKACWTSVSTYASPRPSRVLARASPIPPGGFCNTSWNLSPLQVSGLENFRVLPTRMISLEFIEQFLKILRENWKRFILIFPFPRNCCCIMSFDSRKCQ